MPMYTMCSGSAMQWLQLSLSLWLSTVCICSSDAAQEDQELPTPVVMTPLAKDLGKEEIDSLRDNWRPVSSAPGNVAVFEDGFSEQEVDAVKQMIESRRASLRSVRELDPYGVFNQSRVTFVPAHQEFMVIYQKIAQLATRAVKEKQWNLKLDYRVGGEFDQVQDVSYDPGSFYSLHVDAAAFEGPSHSAQTMLARKLTIVVQLSRGNTDYTGGQLFYLLDGPLAHAGAETATIQDHGQNFTVTYAPTTPGTVIIMLAEKVWHGVQPILSGRRNVLVWWMSGSQLHQGPS